MDVTNQKLGYQILLNDLTDQIEPDSILPYVKNMEVMEGMSEKTLTRQLFCNIPSTIIRFSKKKEIKQIKKNKTLRWIIFGLSLTSFTLFILALLFFLSNKKNKALSISLSKENINLNQALYKHKSVNNDGATPQEYNSPIENRDKLRQIIKT